METITYITAHQMFADYLNRKWGPVCVMTKIHTTARVLEAIDPMEYKEEFMKWIRQSGYKVVGINLNVDGVQHYA